MIHPEDPGNFLESCYTTKTDDNLSQFLVETFTGNLDAFVRLPQKDLISHLEKVNTIDVLYLRTTLHFKFMKTFNLDVNLTRLKNKQNNIPDIYFFTKSLVDNNYSEDDFKKVYNVSKFANDDKVRSSKKVKRTKPLNDSRREQDELDELDDDDADTPLTQNEIQSLKQTISELQNFNKAMVQKFDAILSLNLVNLNDTVKSLQMEIREVKSIITCKCNKVFKEYSNERNPTDPDIMEIAANESQSSIDREDNIEAPINRDSNRNLTDNNTSNVMNLQPKVSWGYMPSSGPTFNRPAHNFDSQNPYGRYRSTRSDNDYNRGRNRSYSRNGSTHKDNDYNRGRKRSNSRNTSSNGQRFIQRSRSRSASKHRPAHKFNPRPRPTQKTLYSFNSADPYSKLNPINHDDQVYVQNETEKDWKTAGPKKRNKNRANQIIGAQNNTQIKSSITDKKYSLYMGHIHNDINIDQLIEFLNSLDFPVFDIEELQNKHRNFKSLKFKIKQIDKTKAFDPSIWPDNVKIRPYFEKSKRMIDTSEDSTNQSNRN